MKTIIQESFKKLLADKYLFGLNCILVLLSIIVCLVVGFSVSPSDLQLVTHYSAFGITHLYRDQWFYLLTFVIFPLVVCVLHSIVSVKLLIVKDRSLALMFLWAGIGIVLLDWAMATAILNVWVPL